MKEEIYKLSGSSEELREKLKEKSKEHEVVLK